MSPRTPGREAEDVAGFVAEDWLASLDPIGWRFGLERINALLAALGDPQLQFESIHVVGTNGKSSVTQMTSALLEASGRATGAYLSPHSERWAERVRIGGAEIDADAFERAVGAVADVVPEVEVGFQEDERVTQFEAATAAAFVALSNAGVEVGVIEAGLGGRLDATNVLDSRVTVLTSIGLDHTQWLGETEHEIAGEKLAVLSPGTALVLGDVSPEVAERPPEPTRRSSTARSSKPPPKAKRPTLIPIGGQLGRFAPTRRTCGAICRWRLRRRRRSWAVPWVMTWCRALSKTSTCRAASSLSRATLR